MLRRVEGIYRNGQIESTDPPNDVSDRTQVLVTFLDAGKIDPAKLRQLTDQLETIAITPIAAAQIEKAYCWYRK